MTSQEKQTDMELQDKIADFTDILLTKIRQVEVCYCGEELDPALIKVDDMGFPSIRCKDHNPTEHEYGCNFYMAAFSRKILRLPGEAPTKERPCKCHPVARFTPKKAKRGAFLSCGRRVYKDGTVLKQGCSYFKWINE